MGKCAFCNKNEGTEPIIDSETEQEILICEYCDSCLSWERVKKSYEGYDEVTLSKLDEVIDNEIEYRKELEYEKELENRK